MSELPQPTRSTDDHAVSSGVGTGKSSTRAGRRWQRSQSSPHSSKFRTATAILIGLALAAIVITVAIASKGRQGHSTQQWSSWQPSDSGTVGARDIADYVAPFYRISSVDQLAVVTVVNLESSTAAAAAQQAAASGTTPNASTSGLQVAVHPNPTSSAVSLLNGNTIAYNLCGIGGKGCAIGVGTASSNRLLLLRREALELALYTFKYIHGIQNVIAILPPGRTTQTSTLTKRLPTSDSVTKPLDIAVLFVRPEVGPLLEQPLSATFPEPNPPTVAEMSRAPEAGLVDQITARGLFSEHLQQAQDGSNLIVLDPLPPQ
ncbi:MAG TPA: hypothetical protein VGL51_18440 [Solirubrobacteraceae bacterium]|jgi:hypothetical protein